MRINFSPENENEAIVANVLTSTFLKGPLYYTPQLPTHTVARSKLAFIKR